MTEFIDKDGFICYRLGGKKYTTKHRYLYQQYNNCQLERNEVVIFLDGNNRNFNKENLYKVTRGELVLINRWYKISSDPNETLTKIAVIRLKQKRIEVARELGLCNSAGAIKEDVAEIKRRYAERHPDRVQQNVKNQIRKRKERMSDPEYRALINKRKREWYRKNKCK